MDINLTWMDGMLIGVAILDMLGFILTVTVVWAIVMWRLESRRGR